MPELRALHEGFHTVPWRSHLSLFTGDELQELMCGASSLDAQLLWENLEFDKLTRDSALLGFEPSLAEFCCVPISILRPHHACC